ncbi:hypothetical protein ACVXHA_13025 [Escherichia coli]
MEFGEKGEKARWKREKLRLPPIPEPEIDPVLKELLYAYSGISRADVMLEWLGAFAFISDRDK